MFVFKLVAGTIFTMALYIVVLFSAAGTWSWWRAWVFLGIAFIGTVGSMFSLWRDRKDLLAERMRPVVQKGQPWLDRIVVLPFVVSYVSLYIVIPRDVFHWHLLPKPAIIVSSFGLVLFLIGWRIVFLALYENPFAASVVKYQAERQHKLVDTGVYSVVRHPMYAGMIPLLAGTSLWLESYAAAIYTLVPAGFLALRILVEERFLERQLLGYLDYMKRVRYRLIPYVW